MLIPAYAKLKTGAAASRGIQLQQARAVQAAQEEQPAHIATQHFSNASIVDTTMSGA